MANAIVKMTIMPESPEVDMDAVKEAATQIFKAHGAIGDIASELVPIAFGIKHLKVAVMFDNEKQIEYEEVADEVTSKVDGVSDAKVEAVDLAMG